MPLSGEWKEFYGNILGSSTAGLIARTICHPIDTAKSRLQSIEYNSYRNMFALIRDTFLQEGWRGLYRGFGAVAIGGAPGTCIYLTAYETSKNKLMEQTAVTLSPFTVFFLGGIIAEACCCVVFVPVDVIKERLQVQRNLGITALDKQQYKGSIDAMKKILQTEGLHGIYRGYGATLLSYSPFSAIYFLIYEGAKEKVSPDGNIPFTKALVCSAIAGAFASYVTSPLDMAKLRLQIQRMPKTMSNVASDDMTRYKNYSDVLRKVYQANGIRGLFRGASARVFFHTPSTAITMGLFEECKRLWMRTID